MIKNVARVMPKKKKIGLDKKIIIAVIGSNDPLKIAELFSTRAADGSGLALNQEKIKAVMGIVNVFYLALTMPGVTVETFTQLITLIKPSFADLKSQKWSRFTHRNYPRYPALNLLHLAVLNLSVCRGLEKFTVLHSYCTANDRAPISALYALESNGFSQADKRISAHHLTPAAFLLAHGGIDIFRMVENEFNRKKPAGAPEYRAFIAFHDHILLTEVDPEDAETPISRSSFEYAQDFGCLEASSLADHEGEEYTRDPIRILHDENQSLKLELKRSKAGESEAADHVRDQRLLDEIDRQSMEIKDLKSKLLTMGARQKDQIKKGVAVGVCNVDKLQAERSVLEKKNADLERQVSDRDRQLASLKEQLAALTTDKAVDDRHASDIALETDNAALRVAHTAIKEKYDRLREAFRQLNEKLEKMTEEINKEAVDKEPSLLVLRENTKIFRRMVQAVKDDVAEDVRTEVTERHEAVLQRACDSAHARARRRIKSHKSARDEALILADMTAGVLSDKLTAIDQMEGERVALLEAHERLMEEQKGASEQADLLSSQLQALQSTTPTIASLQAQIQLYQQDSVRRAGIHSKAILSANQMSAFAASQARQIGALGMRISELESAQTNPVELAPYYEEITNLQQIIADVTLEKNRLENQLSHARNSLVTYKAAAVVEVSVHTDESGLPVVDAESAGASDGRVRDARAASHDMPVATSPTGTDLDTSRESEGDSPVWGGAGRAGRAVVSSVQDVRVTDSRLFSDATRTTSRSPRGPVLPVPKSQSLPARRAT